MPGNGGLGNYGGTTPPTTLHTCGVLPGVAALSNRGVKNYLCCNVGCEQPCWARIYSFTVSLPVCDEFIRGCAHPRRSLNVLRCLVFAKVGRVGSHSE